MRVEHERWDILKWAAGDTVHMYWRPARIAGCDWEPASTLCGIAIAVEQHQGQMMGSPVTCWECLKHLERSKSFVDWIVWRSACDFACANGRVPERMTALEREPQPPVNCRDGDLITFTTIVELHDSGEVIQTTSIDQLDPGPFWPTDPEKYKTHPLFEEYEQIWLDLKKELGF